MCTAVGNEMKLSSASFLSFFAGMNASSYVVLKELAESVFYRTKVFKPDPSPLWLLDISVIFQGPLGNLLGPLESAF